MRKELEIRITVPHDDDLEYLSDIFLQGIQGFADYLIDCKRNVPNTGRHFVDEAIVWWTIREIL